MDQLTFLQAVQALWPVLAGFTLVIVWLVRELDKRKKVADCHQCRKECLERMEKQINVAKGESIRVEAALGQFRMEIKNDLTELTRLVIEAIKGKDPHV